MKLVEALKQLGSSQALLIAEKHAHDLNWNEEVLHVFNVIVKDSDRVPNIGGKKDDAETTIKKWIQRYKSGHDNRASVRIAKALTTVPDPIVNTLINVRMPHLSEQDLLKIGHAHQIAMSVENLLGLLLEEYLAINLKQIGWHCAWGETVKSVDFVNVDGRLLQIKNRSNSENSSSSAVRNGTQIKKWYRIKANKVEYMWASLNSFCGTTVFSEQAFVNFATECIQNNPESIRVETENSWLKIFKI